MSSGLRFDDDLARRLPLPLAKLYIHAHHIAKTPLDRHQTAYFLWEAALRLLASTAVVSYAERPGHGRNLEEALRKLARPALGDWWSLLNRLVLILSDAGDAGFGAVRDLLLGGARSDMPRAVELHAAICEARKFPEPSRTHVRLHELFDRLVNYRNKEQGHGALGRRPSEFYDRVGRALLPGVSEILGRLDPLAGRRLVYVEEVRLQKTGQYLVEWSQLTGESARRIESLERPAAEATRLPRPEQVYLDNTPDQEIGGARPAAPSLVSLRPLIIYDPRLVEVLFLNSQEKSRHCEYLCFTTGDQQKHDELEGEQRELLARALGKPVPVAEFGHWAASPPEPLEAPAEPVDGPPPRWVGEFALLSELGHGNMGKVYRAWQQSLGRQVALKVIAGANDSKARARFRREMRALSKVNHPNLVRIYTSEFDGEPNYYTMELVEGATLSAVGETLHGRSPSAAAVNLATWSEALTTACKDSRDSEQTLSSPGDDPAAARPPAGVRQSAPSPDLNPSDRGYVRQVVELVRQVSLAAHALHSAEVVHRDIKPGNIMVTADGSQAVLMDLGLAQLADDVEGKLTRTRQFVGTLRYASPEQVLSVGKIDARSDIYSLGATLWELLTLRPIYAATDGTPTPELMRRITSDDPERIRKHHPGIAADLEAIVRKCLEKDPARRYATAADLAADLGRWERRELVSAQPLSLGYLASKFVRRYRAPLAVAGVIAAVLLGSVVAAFIGITRAYRIAVDTGDKLREQQYDNHIAVAERELTLNQDIGLASDLLLNCDERQRGWEWRYLMRLRDGGRAPLEGHKRGLWGAEFSPDSRRIATASIDGTVKIWEAASGRLLRSIDADTLQPLSFLGSPIALPGIPMSILGNRRIPAMCIAFSPDGRQVASGSFAPRLNLRESPGLVRIWDAETGRLVSEFKEQLGVVLSLAYSPDGRRIASSSINPDNTFVVWEVKTGEVVRVVRGHSSHVHRLRYSPDGRLLAASDTDGTVKLWDAATLDQVLSIDAHPAPVVGVAFAPPDGLRFATAGEDGTVRVWETATGKNVLELKGHTGSALDVRFSPDGERIVSAGFDKTVRLWDARTGKEKITLRGHTDTVWNVAFSPDGRQLVSSSFDKTARIWDTTPRQDQAGPGLFTAAGTRAGHDDRVNSVAFSPDRRYLAASTWGKEIRIWDGTTGEEFPPLKGHKATVWCVALSPDSRRLASASWDHKVKVWDRESRRELLTFSGHTAPVHSVAFSPDGTRLVSGGFDGQVYVWDAVTGEVTAHCEGFVFPILAVAFSPDGTRVASGGADRSVKIWDAETGRTLMSLNGHEAAIHGMAFSRDGKRLVSASWDHTLRVWDVDPEGRVASPTGSLLTLEGHEDRVHGVAFAPDGTRIASASEDKTVRMWDSKTGQEVMPPLRHRGVVWSVAFSPDGKRLAAGCWSSSSWVKTWNVE